MFVICSALESRLFIFVKLGSFCQRILKQTETIMDLYNYRELHFESTTRSILSVSVQVLTVDCRGKLNECQTD